MTALSIMAEKQFKMKQSAKKWKEFFGMFKATKFNKKSSEDVPIKLTPEGLSVRCMDAAHISLMDAFMPKSEFLSYSCAREVEFSLKLEKILKTLATMRDNEIVTLEMDGDDLAISTVYPLDDIKTLQKTYKLPTDKQTGQSPLPKITFNSKFSIHTETFRNVLRSLQSTSDRFIKIETTDKGVIFTAENVSVTLPNWDVESKEFSNAQYALEYLSKLVAATTAPILTFEYSSKMPLKISMPNADYYIAPRIADDEKESKKE